MTEFSVLVKGNFCIEGDHLIGSGSDQGVDFHHCTVFRTEHCVHRREHLSEGLQGSTAQTERHAKVSLLEAEKSNVCVDNHFVN